ncbi:MAG TPA: MBL fold metallo-hydrolase [Thermoleophilaceae bacterium]|nr:MBL fold metallo-hydrolase [Thermoleophilaceae bacterium]
MVFRQITHDDLGCASYLIGDEKAGVAAVVDPRFGIDEYLEMARYLHVRIEHILETHNHADHLSGHGRLAAATGATIHIHRDAAPEYEHEPFDDGWVLELGAVRVKALHTPGHRPEHTAFALSDTRRGDDEPWAVLTGDTLFVGDIARPDLAVDKEDGARGIFQSLHEKLLPLPPETEVWPGHLGGSLCGGPGMDMKVSSTIGFERRHNRVLDIDEETEFVDTVTAGLPPQPPNFQRVVALNRGPLVTTAPQLLPLAPLQVERAWADGALLVDVRTPYQFDDAHVPGAVCIPIVEAGFGTKLAWVADHDQDIVLIGRDDDDAAHAAALAAAIGLRNIGGYLHGGMTSWRIEDKAVESIERIDVDGLHERRDEVQILDVREQSEWDEVHIPNSLHIPYHDVREIPAALDPGLPVAVICASGRRSVVAASLLQRYGRKDVIHVVEGGVGTWARNGYETSRAT